MSSVVSALVWSGAQLSRCARGSQETVIEGRFHEILFSLSTTGRDRTICASLPTKEGFNNNLKGQHYPPMQHNNAGQQTSLQVVNVQARAPLLQKASRPLCSHSRRPAVRPTASNVVAASASDAGAPPKSSWDRGHHLAEDCPLGLHVLLHPLQLHHPP